MKSWLILLFSVSLFFIMEYKLEKYGLGNGIFNSTLPYEFNTDYNQEKIYDDYGFLIEEQQFISVIESGRTYSDDQGYFLKIKQITKYAINNKKIYLIANTDKGETIIQVVLDMKRPMGNKIKYIFFKTNEFKTKDFDWIDVSSSKFLLRKIFLLLKIAILIQTYMLISKTIKNRKKALLTAKTTNLGNKAERIVNSYFEWFNKCK